jgi:hypothetical protein
MRQAHFGSRGAHGQLSRASKFHRRGRLPADFIRGTAMASRTVLRFLVAAMVLTVILANLLPGAAAAQQTASDTTTPWGAVTDGLQLRIAAGGNLESIARTQQLYLSVGWRNVSNEAIIADILKRDNTFEFEYEIDGIWYAFEHREPVPTSLSRMLASFRSSGLSGGLETIAAGAVTSSSLNVPLVVRSGRTP